MVLQNLSSPTLPFSIEGQMGLMGDGLGSERDKILHIHPHVVKVHHGGTGMMVTSVRPHCGTRCSSAAAGLLLHPVNPSTAHPSISNPSIHPSLNLEPPDVLSVKNLQSQLRSFESACCSRPGLSWKQ